MQGRLPNTVRDWDMMLKRVYETQGPSGFTKYQYSISSILRLLKASPNLKRMLEYCKDIPDPKDVLIDTVYTIILDRSIDTDARMAAVETMKTLLPKMEGYLGLKGAVILESMRESLRETEEESFQDALTQMINATNRRLRECPKAHTVRF